MGSLLYYLKIFYADNISMSDTKLFKTPLEVFGEIFSFNSLPKINNTTYLIITAIGIALFCIFIYIYLADLKNILFKLGSALYLTDPEKIQLLLDCIKNNIGIILGPIFLAVLLFYATHDPKALTNNTSSYVLFIGAIVAICFGLYSSLPDFSKSPYMPFLIGENKEKSYQFL
jgi:hypothetical protein